MPEQTEPSTEPVTEHDRQLVIGAVGHRTLFAPNVEIERQIVAVLQDLIRTEEPGAVSMICSVAEGADRRLLEVAESLGLPYDIVLPCGPDCFREDFTSVASQAEFDRLIRGARHVLEPERVSTKEAGYLWASDVILDRAEILLAVWDGGPGNGLAGTAETVSRALGRGIPVYWIHSDASQAAQLLEPSARACTR